jgi:hypothetical protein
LGVVDRNNFKGILVDQFITDLNGWVTKLEKQQTFEFDMPTEVVVGRASLFSLYFSMPIRVKLTTK